MPFLTLPPLVAVATGILSSTWLAGAIASISVVGVPAAQATPASSALVWRGLFIHGKALAPKLAVGSALSYCLAAWSPSRGRGEYLAAAGLVLAIVPFTLLFMSATNGALLDMAGGSASLSGGQVTGTIRKWGRLNLARSCLPLAAAVVAFVGLVRSGGVS